MDLHQRVNEALQCPLIGMLLFSDEEIEQLKMNVRNDIERAEIKPNRRLTNMDSLLVLLIHLAKKWGEGSERRFWQVLWDEILDDSSYRPSGYFYDDLQKAICNSGKQVFTSEGNKRRFCEFIQYHALAPLSSFHAFVSLIWNAYLDEDLFNANYRVNDLLVGRIVAWLKMKFIGIDDSQINDGFDFDGKTYSIRAAFKYAFIHNSMDEMIWLVQKILMCIDKKYYREAQTSPQDYMDIVCDQYVEKLLFGQISLRKQRLSTPSNILIDISRAYAAYELDEVGNPVLFMPDIRMIDFNENQIQIKVFSNEALITTQVRYIVGEGLRRRLKRIDFQLFDLLPQIPSSIHLRIELWGNAQLLYSSQELLFRSFLLFTEFHEERGNTLPPGEYGLVCSDTILYERKFDGDIVVTSSGCHKTITTKSGNYLSHDKRTVLFMDRKTKQMVCKLEGEPIQDLYADYEGLWLIYKKTPRCILYISTEYSAVSIGVHFDDIFLGSLRSVATEKETGSGVWEINLNAIEGDTCGMHEIRVTDLRVGSGKPICCMLFGVLPKSQVIMSNPFCFGANSSVTVYDGTDKREVNIYADNGCGFIDTKIGRMCVKPPCLRWRIDDEKWQMGCLETVSWYRAPKFHNNVILEVDAPLDSNVELLFGDMRLKTSSQGGNRYLLGDALQDSTAALVAINLKVGALTFQLFKMAFQPMLLSMPFISLDEGYLNFDAQNVFIGGNDSVLEVSLYDENDRQVLCYDTPVRSATATSLKDGYYSVKIMLWIETLINRERFALGTFKNISFGNPARFHFDGCRLHLKKTQCDKGKVRFEDTIIFRIQYLREDLHPVYQGTLSSPGAKSQTVQFIDLGRALRVYCNNCGEWEPANVDIQTKRLVNANADYQKVFPCKSVYYEEDQQNV